MRHLPLVRLGLVVVIAAAFIAILLETQSRARAVAAAALFPPTATDLAATLHRMSLDPEPLTAVGASVSDVNAVVQGGVGYLTDNLMALRAADQAYSDARLEKRALERNIRAGLGTDDDVAARDAAVAIMNQAEQQRQTLLDGFAEQVMAQLSEQERAALQTIRSNRQWKLPTEFLTLELTEPQWVELRNALANERIAAESGEEPDANAQALLQQYRSVPSVATAAANLQANLDAVQSAWNTSTGLGGA